MKLLIGLLRDKTPKYADGTIGSDIPRMVKTFGRGMFVDVTKPKPQLGESLSDMTANIEGASKKKLYMGPRLIFHASSKGNNYACFFHAPQLIEGTDTCLYLILRILFCSWSFLHFLVSIFCSVRSL